MAHTIARRGPCLQWADVGLNRGMQVSMHVNLVYGPEALLAAPFEVREDGGVVRGCWSWFDRLGCSRFHIFETTYRKGWVDRARKHTEATELGINVYSNLYYH